MKSIYLPGWLPEVIDVTNKIAATITEIRSEVVFIGLCNSYTPSVPSEIETYNCFTAEVNWMMLPTSGLV